MSFAARMIHRLALVTPTDGATQDGMGDATPGEPVVETVRCLVQPRATHEVAASHQGGAELADHVIYLERRPSPVQGAWFSDDLVTPENGNRYDITGVRRYDFGRTPHLELDARRVNARELEPTAVS